MKEIIERLFARIYWFYKYIIKESDSGMIFYFTAFAISFIAFFYINFLLAVLYVHTRWEIIRFEFFKYLIIMFSFLIFAIYLFFKHQKSLEDSITEGKRPRFFGDLFVVLYIVVGLFLSYYTFEYLENNE